MANVYVYSGAVGSANGTSWANAYTTLSAALTAGAAGDVFFVASDHAESTATAITLTPPGTAASPNQILSVDRAGSVPPVSADLEGGAQITTTGASSINLAGGYAYFRGITFNCGTGSTSASINQITAAGSHIYENCAFNTLNTGAIGGLFIGNTSPGANRVEWRNCTVGFSHTSQGIFLRNVRMIWRDTPNAIATGGSYVAPAELFKSSARCGTGRLEALDLSALGSGKTIFGANGDPCEFWLKDCKLHASVTVASTPSAPGAAEAYISRSDATDTNYRAEKHTYQGSETTETTIVRTGGASNGTISFSAKVVTTANAEWFSPFEGLPLAAWNSTTGSAVSVTVEGIWNAAALPNNDEIWVDVEYLGTAGSPLGDIVRGTKADVLASGSALTASTQAWDGVAATRANSTAYSLGDVIKVGSNAGRLFFCTTAGTSSGSLPAGYASAIDGDSVTDGTAVFRAGVRFKQTVSVTPQSAGAIYATVMAARPSSTFYVDRKITLA